MSRDLNTKTRDLISANIKHIQEKCMNCYHDINNSQLQEDISLDDIGEKALCFVESLRSSIQNSTTFPENDENLILSEYLAESNKRLTQIEEVAAFTRGAILDVDNEIERLNNLTNIAGEALTRPKVKHNKIRPEHINKAKETFKTLKTELHGLIQSLFPNQSENIMDVLGQLLQEKLDEESNGYIAITQENYKIIEQLRDINVVTLNPYNNMEVKIAY